MLVHGLRLLVALITFAVGVAASLLVGSEGKPGCGKRVYTHAPVHVPAPSLDLPPPQQPVDRCDYNDHSQVVKGGVLQGKTYSKPHPVYPLAAKAAGVEGTVVVKIEVDECGQVMSAEAVGGPELLRDASVEAALQARFAPTRLSGEPVRVTGLITYKFVLQ